MFNDCIAFLKFAIIFAKKLCIDLIIMMKVERDPPKFSDLKIRSDELF